MGTPLAENVTNNHSFDPRSHPAYDGRRKTAANLRPAPALTRAKSDDPEFGLPTNTFE